MSEAEAKAQAQIVAKNCVLRVPGNLIPYVLWEQCSELFSHHYGVWGPLAGDKLKGKRVKQLAKGLQEQHLFPGTQLAVAS